MYLKCYTKYYCLRELLTLVRIVFRRVGNKDMQKQII